MYQRVSSCVLSTPVAIASAGALPSIGPQPPHLPDRLLHHERTAPPAAVPAS